MKSSTHYGGLVMTWIRIDKTAHADERVRAICYNCGSRILQRTWGYLSFGDKFFKRVISEIAEDGSAFYYASIFKSHARLIGIAVRRTEQRRGMGKWHFSVCSPNSKPSGCIKSHCGHPHTRRRNSFGSLSVRSSQTMTPRAGTTKWKLTSNKHHGNKLLSIAEVEQ